MPETGAEVKINLTDFIGGMALGLAGVCAGVWAGVYIGGSAFPVLTALVLGSVGFRAGLWLTRVFPRLRSSSFVPDEVGRCGVFGVFLGFVAGDLIATFADLDRFYLDLVGAGVGLYFGVRIGLARQRATPPAA